MFYSYYRASGLSRQRTPMTPWKALFRRSSSSRPSCFARSASCGQMDI